MKIRKQVYNLTPDDLLEFPVWEFALDEEEKEGQDEATVRPYRFSLTLDTTEGDYILRANFALQDGTRMIGYLASQKPDDKDIARLQPVIVTERGQVLFWYGIIAPKPEKIAQNYKKLGKTPLEVFPVTFKSAVETTMGKVEGMIEGFCYYGRDKSQPLNLRELTIEVIK